MLIPVADMAVNGCICRCQAVPGEGQKEMILVERVGVAHSDFRMVEAGKSVDIVKRLRNSLPQGWIGTNLDEDTDTELYTKTDKFSANKPGSNSIIRVYFIDTKKDGRVNVYLSVDNN